MKTHQSPWTLCVLSLALGLGSLSGCATVKGLFSDDDADKTDSARGIPKQSENAYFESAQEHLSKQRYDLAEKDLMDLRTFYPVGQHTQQAQLDLIYINYQQGEFEEAVLAADRFIRLYPRNPDLDYAHYVKGVSMMNSGFGGVMKYTRLDPAHRDTGYLRSAFDTFGKLVNAFPNSKYIPDATARMHAMYNQFAESEINAARFNIRRGAYVGAAERARWVLQYYPQSPQVPEAIAILSHAYDKLGLGEQAAKQNALLAANYPDLLTNGKANIKTARTSGSLLNRATLGLFGTPKRSIGYTYLGKAGNAPSNITASNATSHAHTSGQQTGLRLPPSASANVQMPKLPSGMRSPSTNISLGLGLPPTDNMSNQADAVNDAELKQQKMQQVLQQRRQPVSQYNSQGLTQGMTRDKLENPLSDAQQTQPSKLTNPLADQ